MARIKTGKSIRKAVGDRRDPDQHRLLIIAEEEDKQAAARGSGSISVFRLKLENHLQSDSFSLENMKRNSLLPDVEEKIMFSLLTV